MVGELRSLVTCDGWSCLAITAIHQPFITIPAKHGRLNRSPSIGNQIVAPLYETPEPQRQNGQEWRLHLASEKNPGSTNQARSPLACRLRDGNERLSQHFEHSPSNVEKCRMLHNVTAKFGGQHWDQLTYHGVLVAQQWKSLAHF